MHLCSGALSANYSLESSSLVMLNSLLAGLNSRDAMRRKMIDGKPVSISLSRLQSQPYSQGESQSDDTRDVTTVSSRSNTKPVSGHGLAIGVVMAER